MQIRYDDPRLTWHGAVSVEIGDGWAMPWRIPHAARSLFHEGLRASAAAASGVRLSFRSDTRTVSGEIVAPVNPKKLDLVCDGRLHATAEIAPACERFEFRNLPAGDKLIELWLPPNFEFRLRLIEIDAGATLAPFEDVRPRWTVYGSSITAASDAASPSRTWPAIVSQGMDWNLTSLGFGGQCHLDTEVARLMRDRPADFLAMCVGINVYGGASLAPRTFRSGIVGFVRLIREKHLQTPFAVMSPIYGADREKTLNAAGFTLAAIRAEVCAAVEALRAAGDANLHYVNGLEILGPEDWRLLPDNLHPNAEGYELMGRHFLEKVAKRTFCASAAKNDGGSMTI